MCDVVFSFFKEKAAYEMRMSDWSSDVCSSDLRSTRVEVGADARVGEDALPSHLGHRYVAVPVREGGPVAGEDDAIHAGKAIRRRDHDRNAEAIDVPARVVLAGAP